MTCWQRLTAQRAALLVDGAAYFKALAATLPKARRSLLIAAWALDGSIALDPKERGQRARLRALINRIARHRPDLEVRILLWDYTVLSIFDSEFWPRWNWEWRTPANVHIHLDDRLPMGACHHQKIVVIDDHLAFCGGIDLTTKRLDTPAHDPDRPKRRDMFGRYDMPFHDLQMMVEGPPAAAIADLIRTRWAKAGAPDVPTPATEPPADDLWPDSVPPDFENIAVGVARTLPPETDAAEVHEIEALFAAAIDRAEDLVYIESQYLALPELAARLARRLAEAPDLEAIIVIPRISHGWLEHQTMDAERDRFLFRLGHADAADRVRVIAPYVTGKHGRAWIMVHSKAMIVDNRILIVGSANFNNRSMRMDSECDLVIDAEHADERKTIAGLRNRLLAEHLGVTPEEVAATHAETGRWVSVVDTHAGGPRSVVPFPMPEMVEDRESLMASLGDPKEPIDRQLLLREFVAVGGRGRRFLRWCWGLVLVAALGAGLLVWQTAADASGAVPASGWFADLRPGPAHFAAAIAIYIAAGLAFVPLTVLVMLTALMFGVWPGLLYAFAGALASATLAYAGGHVMGQRGVGSILGRAVRRYGEGIGRQGIVTIALLRMLPVGPFTVINLIAGASRIRFGDFLMGSVIGLAPGMLLFAGLGSQLGRLWRAPGAGNLALFVGIAGVWALVVWIAQRWLQRRGIGNAPEIKNGKIETAQASDL